MLNKESKIKMHLEFDYDGKKQSFTLPVLPSEFEETRSNNNQTVNIQAIGDVLLKGKKQLNTVSISSFFPAEYDPIYVDVDKGALKTPKEYDEIFKMINDKNITCRFIATGPNTNINMQCVISEYKSGMSQGRDINYSVTFTEYVVISVKTGDGKKRPAASGKSTPKTYKTKKGDTLSKIAKSKLKSKSKAKTIYTKNKKAIDKYFKSHAKKLKGAKKKKWNATAKVNRTLKAGMKLKLK